MGIARGAIDRALLTWVMILVLLGGGIWGFATIGRLEDPSFTIKRAVVITDYPGASAEQVAREVTEPLESAIQKMSELDQITSTSTPGRSRIDVEIESRYDGGDLPQIWDKLRARVDNARGTLPPDAGAPYVNDGFGDVFGIFYAVTAPDYTDAEIHDISDFLRREILAVDGVADVEIAGLPEEAIYVEPDPALMTNLGVSPDAVLAAISDATDVASSGNLQRAGQRIRMETPTAGTSLDDLHALSIGARGEVVNLADFATISRGRVPEPAMIVRYDGVEAFTMGVSGKAGRNIVEVGEAVDARLDRLMHDLPVGVSLEPVYLQHQVVDEASSAFLLNLALSVAIVIVVLALFMGWRAAVVVGTTLFLTVVGTVFFMKIFGIEMERISLGALIIAMGMLVDNAIVVAEGMQSDMAAGKTSREAAENTAGKTQVPLLGATIIGIMAFAGIGLSPDATGEFLFSLFAVIGISLLLSWVMAITATPLLAHLVFKRGDATGQGAYDGPIFRAYGALLRLALKLRWLVVAALAGVTVLCYAIFANVSQQFFPDSATPIFYAHYTLPQGADIAETSRQMHLLEEWLAERDDMVSVTTFVGGGASRFMLTYAPSERSPTYGHLVIRTETTEAIPSLRRDLEAFADAALPAGEFRTERLAFGPGGGAPIEARFLGPDADTLRALAAEAEARLYAASDRLVDLRTDWRERELVVSPRYDEERAQRAGISTENVSRALRLATTGDDAGIYREGSRLIPIEVRMPGAAEEGGAHLMSQPVYSSAAGIYVPLEQMINGFAYEVQDTLIHRRDRVPAITVQADLPPGANAATVFAEIRGTVEAMELPEGYRLEWGGEHESSTDAQASLGRTLPISLLVMVLISVLLFGRLRQPLVIWLLVPMSVNGVALGLLASGLPFSFTALLGLLSLSGMLLKNGIVLVEEIDLTRATGLPFSQAIVAASTSRLRPVMLAAATTILGMVPLLWDPFFASMSVTIMGGLGFATILTLVAAPVFYYIVFPGARKAERAQAAELPA